MARRVPGPSHIIGKSLGVYRQHALQFWVIALIGIPINFLILAGDWWFLLSVLTIPCTLIVAAALASAS